MKRSGILLFAFIISAWSGGVFGQIKKIYVGGGSTTDSIKISNDSIFMRINNIWRYQAKIVSGGGIDSVHTYNDSLFGRVNGIWVFQDSIRIRRDTITFNPNDFIVTHDTVSLKTSPFLPRGNVIMTMTAISGDVSMLPDSAALWAGLKDLPGNTDFYISDYQIAGDVVTVYGGGLRSIGGGVFSYNAYLEEFVSKSVERLLVDDITGYGAFESCKNATTFTLPAAAYIGTSAFSGCSNATTFTLPAAAYIGTSAFSGCSKATTFTLPAAAYIGTSAFSGCSSATLIDLPAATGFSQNSIRGFGGTFANLTIKVLYDMYNSWWEANELKECENSGATINAIY